MDGVGENLLACSTALLLYWRRMQPDYTTLKNLLDAHGGHVPGQQIPPEWIDRAEAALGIAFPPSYRWWLSHYGDTALGDSSIYTILQQDFDDACGPDIVYQHRMNQRNSIAIANGLIVFEPESSDEIYYFDLTLPDADGEYPVMLRDLESGTQEVLAPSFAAFLERQLRMRGEGRE